VLATILGAGLACVIAAIVGGGLKAFGVEVPLLTSVKRQLLLGALGAALVGFAVASDGLLQPLPLHAPSVGVASNSARRARPSQTFPPSSLGSISDFVAGWRVRFLVVCF
jgi:hypothetical protein